MFSNVSISKRLILGFSFLIVLLVATNVVGLMRMSDIMGNLEDVVEDRLPKINMANKTVEQALGIGRALRGFFMVDTAAERAKMRAEVDDIRNSNAATLAELDKALNVPAARTVMDKITQSRETLQPMYQKFYDLAEADINEARKMITGEFVPANNAFIASLQEMVKFQEGVMLQGENEAKAFYQQAVKISLGVIIGGVLIACLLSFWLIRSITGPLKQIQLVVMDAQTNNDFTHFVAVSSRDEVGQTASAFNDLMDTLRKTFTQIKESVSGVDRAAESLVTASDESARASNLTSEAASSMASSVEEMSVSINQVSDNAKSAFDLANKAGKLSGEGGEVIANTVKEMQRIANAIDQVAGVIGELGQQSDQISSIVQVIKEVADQTNLLALNAAIEAARAGEAGRGFAVVADEVRKLAERTTKATSEISTMIGGIQTSSQSAVTAMQQTVEQVKSGREMAEHAGNAIVEIRQAASDVVHVVEDIASSIAEQSAASQSIAQQLEQVAQAAEENSSSSAETSSSAHHLSDLAHEMHDAAAKFKI